MAALSIMDSVFSAGSFPEEGHQVVFGSIKKKVGMCLTTFFILAGMYRRGFGSGSFLPLSPLPDIDTFF